MQPGSFCLGALLVLICAVAVKSQSRPRPLYNNRRIKAKVIEQASWNKIPTPNLSNMCRGRFQHCFIGPFREQGSTSLCPIDYIFRLDSFSETPVVLERRCAQAKVQIQCAGQSVTYTCVQRYRILPTRRFKVGPMGDYEWVNHWIRYRDGCSLELEVAKQ